MLRLTCQVQNYAWGRLASDDSEVAALVYAAGQPVDPSKPYAELWMGTHPSGESVTSQGEGLKDWLSKHAAALGDEGLKRFGADLPFLFKVLSVQTALSIQSHPDKALAERLHAERPQDYKDDNHKPEMAIAISDFEALCGFVGPAELAGALASFPELHTCLGAGVVEAVASSTGGPEQKQHLRAAFTALMTCDADKVATSIDTIQQRLEADSRERELTPKERLLLRLNQQYPRDVGVLAACFLNYMRLTPGQAIYLAANEPHAYLSGEIIECMATSDNVIRAGLTPKLRDTEVLCSSLTYHQALPQVLQGEQVQQYTTVYCPPFDEFEVFCLDVPAGASTLVPANHGPSMLLVQSGAGLATATPTIQHSLLETCPQLAKGAVFFVPAQTSLALTAGDAGLVLWIAAVNNRVFGDRFALPNAKAGLPQQIDA